MFATRILADPLSLLGLIDFHLEIFIAYEYGVQEIGHFIFVYLFTGLIYTAPINTNSEQLIYPFQWRRLKYTGFSNYTTLWTHQFNVKEQ